VALGPAVRSAAACGSSGSSNGYDVTMTKPIPEGGHAKRPQKRCYELASEAVSNDESKRLLLVHGVRRDRGGFEHAWVYDPADDTVFDTTDQHWYASAEYPGIERVRYTHGEVLRHIVDTRHFGPWN
jgi:hypothetical protein